MTGLPEYRNGVSVISPTMLCISLTCVILQGLLIDYGYLVPKPKAFLSSLSLDTSSEPFSLSSLPPLPASHPAMIEWRAMTVIALDRLRDGINDRLDLKGSGALSLPQVLESATWKGGREVAKRLRPKTGGPPINVVSDGTVF